MIPTIQCDASCIRLDTPEYLSNTTKTPPLLCTYRISMQYEPLRPEHLLRVLIHLLTNGEEGAGERDEISLRKFHRQHPPRRPRTSANQFIRHVLCSFSSYPTRAPFFPLTFTTSQRSAKKLKNGTYRWTSFAMAIPLCINIGVSIASLIKFDPINVSPNPGNDTLRVTHHGRHTMSTHLIPRVIPWRQQPSVKDSRASARGAGVPYPIEEAHEVCLAENVEADFARKGGVGGGGGGRAGGCGHLLDLICFLNALILSSFLKRRGDTRSWSKPRNSVGGAGTKWS